MIIREATIDDTPAMARVQVDTKKACYRDFYPADLLDGLSYEKTAAGWRRNLWEQPRSPGAFSLLAEDEVGAVTGVLIAGPRFNEENEAVKLPEAVNLPEEVNLPEVENQPEAAGLWRGYGEIYVLYVRPEWHGHGVGRALVAAAARRLLGAGMAHLLIWVLAANPARGFYEALGGRLLRERVIDSHGYTMPEVAYAWNDLRLLAGDVEVDR